MLQNIWYQGYLQCKMVYESIAFYIVIKVIKFDCIAFFMPR